MNSIFAEPQLSQLFGIGRKLEGIIEIKIGARRPLF
jgi:hypothetical protein